MSGKEVVEKWAKHCEAAGVHASSFAASVKLASYIDEALAAVEERTGMRYRLDKAQRLTEEQRERAKKAEAALYDAIELAEEGWGYANDYFRQKWDYEARIGALRERA